jgi:phenylacetate-CoA ligase
MSTAATTPFWRAKFKKYHVNIFNTEGLTDEIRKLPILTKSEVKAHHHQIVNNLVNMPVTNSHTSGTTGSGMVFPETLEMQNKQWAVWWRYRSWYGLDTSTWMGWFGGRTIINIDRKNPPYWRVIPPLKQIMFSAHHLNEHTVKSYLDQIVERKLTWLHGYPSQLGLFANLIKSTNIPVKTEIKTITVGAENLLARQRSVIEEVFGVQVHQHYGLAEGVANISEHPDGSLLPDQDFAFTELIPFGSPGSNTCKIIGTNYNNLAFPLIRYNTDDLAEVNKNSDGTLSIRAIDGREEDYISLPNGVKLGRLDHIFKDMTHIEESQIYQPDIKNIIIKVVKADHYNLEEDEPELIHEVRKRMGKEIGITVQYVKNIKRDKSGKFRFVKSEVKNDIVV